MYLYIYVVSAHCYFCGEQFIHASQSTKIKVFAFIIFNPNLKMLLRSKIMGLLSWHQYDGLGMSVTSLTRPSNCQCSFLNEFIQSICSRKNKPCPLFSSFSIRFLLEVKTVANFQFKRTLMVPWSSLKHGVILCWRHFNWIKKTGRDISSSPAHF